MVVFKLYMQDDPNTIEIEHSHINHSLTKSNCHTLHTGLN